MVKDCFSFLRQGCRTLRPLGQVCPQASLVDGKDVTDHSSENLSIVFSAIDVTMETARSLGRRSNHRVHRHTSGADDLLSTPKSGTFSALSRARLRMLTPGEMCQWHEG